MKVVFITDIPTSYRDPLFSEIGHLKDVELHVMYCSDRQRGREWSVRKYDFSSEILLGWGTTIRRDDGVVLMLNPSVWRRLRAASPDVVILGGYFQPTMILAMYWCRRNRVPYMIQSESHARNLRPRIRELMKRPILRRVLASSAANLVMGPSSRAYLEAYGAEPERIFFFPNTPDVRLFASDSAAERTKREENRKRFGLKGDGPVVLFLGRLIAAKNVGTLIRAFARVKDEHPDANLLIAGTGPEMNRLQNLVGALGVRNVVFTGVVQPVQAPALYASADIFALPSSAEPWGVVVLEAMACSLPVLVSDMVGASDLVQEGVSGFIIGSNDESAWAAALRRLLRDDNLRHRLGRAGFSQVLRHDYTYCIGQLKDALSILHA